MLSLAPNPGTRELVANRTSRSTRRHDTSVHRISTHEEIQSRQCEEIRNWVRLAIGARGIWVGVGNNPGRLDAYNNHNNKRHHADKFLSKVLAVDLLNPSPAAEAKKHKLKVSTIFDVVDIVQVALTRVTSDPGARSPLLLHGRQVPRLLHNHDRLLPRANRRHLPGLHQRAVPADRWQGQTDRGLLFPEKVDGATIFFLSGRAGHHQGAHLKICKSLALEIMGV